MVTPAQNIQGKISKAAASLAGDNAQHAAMLALKHPSLWAPEARAMAEQLLRKYSRRAALARRVCAP